MLCEFSGKTKNIDLSDVVNPSFGTWMTSLESGVRGLSNSTDQKRAAGLFLDFLMSDQIQRAALEHGFRPGNLNVPVKTSDSPFVRYEASGLKVDLGSV